MILVVVCVLGFGWLMGGIGTWKRQVHFSVLYGFAGGVEVGSPVRVSGVKVGKVESIEFVAGEVEGVSLRVNVAVSQAAATQVREDSRFFINMAGIIGERYVEISPGSPEIRRSVAEPPPA